MKRKQVMHDLDRQQIQARPVWHQNHLQRTYQECQTCEIEQAVSLYEQTINIPRSVNLSGMDRDTVIKALTP